MNSPQSNTVERFTDRVADYVLYRPTYPPGVLQLLQDELKLTPAWVIADVGSGPGISSRLFLDNGNEVFGVEPNVAMREAAEQLLANYPQFHNIAGSAEESNLPDQSIDLVVAGQAFHWFNVEQAKREFQRILRPGSQVVLLWNTQRTQATTFLRDYEALLREFGTDYAQVHHKNVREETLQGFYAPLGYHYRKLDNEQTLDFDGLRGRLLSSSFVPGPDHPRRAPMLKELETLFAKHHHQGKVQILYDTEVYYGQVT